MCPNVQKRTSLRNVYLIHNYFHLQEVPRIDWGGGKRKNRKSWVGKRIGVQFFASFT